MSDQVIPASVVARVRKLLNLAGNNSNENEASSAASKAQEIMAEFNISLSEIGQESSVSATGDAAREKQETGVRRAAQEARMTELRAKWAAEKTEKAAVVVAPLPESKPETEKEREKREAADRRWHEAYQRRQEKEASRVDQYAYSRGSATGRDIGLDTQISSGGDKKALPQ